VTERARLLRLFVSPPSVAAAAAGVRPHRLHSLKKLESQKAK
jgi:hypothetical protein